MLCVMLNKCTVTEDKLCLIAPSLIYRKNSEKEVSHMKKYYSNL